MKLVTVVAVRERERERERESNTSFSGKIIYFTKTVLKEINKFKEKNKSGNKIMSSVIYINTTHNLLLF